MSSERLRELGRHVAAYEDGIDAGDRTLLLRETLTGHAGKRTRTGRSPARLLVALSLGVITAVAVLVSVVLLGSTDRPGALSFTAGDPPRTGVVGETFSAPRASGMSLHFSDGSQVLLQADTRARVTRLGPASAEIAVDQGEVRVAVVPRAENDWRLRSGPFTIEVKGTQFDVRWDPRSEELDLRLHEGRVNVSGCGFGSGRSVTAGQRAIASCRRGIATVTAHVGTAQPGTDVAPPANAVAGRTSVPAPRAAGWEHTAPAQLDSGTPSGAGAPNWVLLARSGLFADAYAAARAQGFPQESRARSADEVLLLGETARLVGQPSDARLAYGAVRSRFPGSRAAAQAAFHLGQLEMQAGDAKRAVVWLETYLDEQPSGALAVAARGRLIEAKVALGDHEDARAAARVYLERHPTGPHANAARDLLDDTKTTTP